MGNPKYLVKLPVGTVARYMSLENALLFVGAYFDNCDEPCLSLTIQREREAPDEEKRECCH